MVKKRNDIDVEDITGTSQYDGQQVLKDAHSLPGHYIRTKESLTLVRSFFDTFTVDYAGVNPTQICYFAGTKPHVTSVGMVDDVSSSLVSTYFIIAGGRKGARYVVYFKVNGVGVSPGLDGTIDVEVNINEDDVASVIALAVQLALANIEDTFKIARKNSVLEISTTKLGVTYDTLDVGTGFTISNDAGTSEQVQKVDLTYSSNDHPIYQSQELIGYKYNVYTGRFELFNEAIPASYSEVIYDTISVGNTATLVAVGTANLDGRTNITLQPKGKTIWYGFDNTVTSGNSGKSFKLTSNSLASIDLEDGVELYAITSSGTANVAVSESK